MLAKLALLLLGVALVATFLAHDAQSAAVPADAIKFEAGDSSDRLEELKACVSVGEGSKLPEFLETCRAEEEKLFRIRMCMIKKTLRSDIKEMKTLLWCLFKS